MSCGEVLCVCTCGEVCVCVDEVCGVCMVRCGVREGVLCTPKPVHPLLLQY